MTPLKKLQKVLRARKMPAFLVTKPENVFYLCGFTGSNGSLFVTPAKHVLITDARYFYTAEKRGVPYHDQSKGLKGLLGRVKKVAFEEVHLSVAGLGRLKKAASGVTWQPASGLVEELRMIKRPEELTIIRKAARITDQLLTEFKKTIRVGQSEDEMEWNLLSIARKLGAEGFSFPPIITFGKENADIHHQKGNSRLKKGQPILLDMGIVYKGYITDMTRMIYLWSQAPLQRKMHDVVLAANQAAIKAVRVGKKLGDIDKVARDIIKEAGWGDYFLHSTGHGTGLEVHEAPSVSAGSKTKITPGMIFTIEPGVYIKGKGGVRIEDMVYVNEKGGVEVLTRSERGLTI